MFAVDGLSGRYLYNVMRGGAGASAAAEADDGGGAVKINEDSLRRRGPLQEGKSIPVNAKEE